RSSHRVGREAAVGKWQADHARGHAATAAEGGVRAGRSRLPTGEIRDVHPPAFTPRLERQLGELHALRAFVKIVRERSAGCDVQQEPLPLHLEGVVEWTVVSYIPPPCAVVD